MNTTSKAHPMLADTDPAQMVEDTMRLAIVRFKQEVSVASQAPDLKGFLDDVTRAHPRNNRPLHRYIAVAPRMARLAPQLAPLLKRPLDLAAQLIDAAVGAPMVDEDRAQEEETACEGLLNAVQMRRQRVRTSAMAREGLDALDRYEPTLKTLRRIWTPEAAAC